MPENENIVWVGQAGFEADRDRLIVLQDEFRSGYECQTCMNQNKRTIPGNSLYEQKEVSTVSCQACLGKGKRPKAGNPSLEVSCSDCESRGYVVCPDCGGRGGLLVMAEKSEGRPTTGTIVSIGPDVAGRKRGEKVIYPSHAGHAYDLEAVKQDGTKVKVVLVILRDQEILSKMYGILEQNQVKRSAALHTAA